jgi:hypothetical protein
MGSQDNETALAAVKQLTEVMHFFVEHALRVR